jgi:hypothetical protein
MIYIESSTAGPDESFFSKLLEQSALCDLIGSWLSGGCRKADCDLASSIDAAIKKFLETGGAPPEDVKFGGRRIFLSWWISRPS